MGDSVGTLSKFGKCLLFIIVILFAFIKREHNILISIILLSLLLIIILFPIFTIKYE